MILRIVIICLTVLATACEPRGLYDSADGEGYLANIVEVGWTLGEASSALDRNEIPYRLIAAAECGDVGDMWYDPKYVCAGGPALRLTLSENARPYNPFYSPTMNAFFAFDTTESLVSVVVMLEGGD